jgi:hypothetical protein
VIAIGCAVLISLLIYPTIQYNRFAYSQGQFIVYENPDYDISIQYPNDWSVSEDNLLPYQVAIFSAPEIEEEESSVSTVIYIPAELVLAVQPLYLPNMTMGQFIDQFLKEVYPSSADYRIIESSNTTLAGMQAQKIVMYEYVGQTNSKVMRVIGIQNGAAYMVKYMAEPGQFSAYLPIAQTMIDSFQPSLIRTSAIADQQSLSPANQTSINNTQGSNITQSTMGSELPEQTTQSDIILQPKSDSSTNAPQLPQRLILTDDVFGDSRLPLRFSITNGVATDLTSSGSTTGELNEWYPIVTFHFNEPTSLGLVDLNHVLTGPIRSYDSPDAILEEANYWKDVPLNQQVVLEMNQPGLNYLVASVQFANGTSGVYSAVVDVDAFGSKSDGENYLDFKIEEGANLNVLDDSEIEDIQSDPAFQKVMSNLICSDLNNYGFQVCQQRTGSTSTIAEQQPTTSDDIVSLFEDENADEDNDDDDENDENSDDDN